jgi:hypothetical protein
MNPLLPETLLHVVVGDFVDNPAAHPEQDATAVNWMNSHIGPGEWVTAVGNHDLFGRLPPAAAAAWGMPGGGNYVHDIPGVCRLVLITPDDGIENDGYSMKPFTASRLNWVADRCNEVPNVPCFIVCHWSLYDTVAATSDSTTSATTPGFYAYVDAEIETMLADTPNTKAWLSGHTHSPLHVPELVTTKVVGGHSLVAINASAPCYTGNVSDNLSSQQATMYLTVTDGRMDVRFRDHGAGVWTVAGPDRQPVWSALF